MWSPTGLIPWFSKTEGNTYATLLHHPLLFGEIQRSAQEVAIAEVAAVEDARMDATVVRSGATSLVRTTGRISLARAPGGISLVRIVLGATPVSLQYRYHQEGMTTTIRTRGLAASRNRVPSPASWAELKPQPFSASSSSLLAR